MRAMLAFVAGQDAPPGAVVPKVVMSERKLRLFLVACCRRRWDLLTNPVYREAVAVAERFAEGDATETERAGIERVIEAVWTDSGDRLMEVAAPVDLHAAQMDYDTAGAALTTCLPFANLVRQHVYWGRARDFVALDPGDRDIHAGNGPHYLARAVSNHLNHTLGDGAPDWAATVGAEHALQADLIRCIAGDPLAPVIANSTWLTTDVVALARGIYDERAFDRLPILADALQDAGCEHPDVLGHCRSGGAHARGCWVIDLILDKQ